MKIISIIPCKEHSERLPNKNILPINGKELFIHSIEFSLKNQITPIVSTDSSHIIEYCQNNGISYYKETVDDSNMCNCIDQVLSQYECDYFVLLQPTSPMRQDNIINQMGLPSTSIYTCDKVKIIGHIGYKFQTAYRDQDTSTKFLYRFDGNAVIVNTAWYKKNNCLFNDESKYFVENVPYSIQIDTQEEYKLLKSIIEGSEL
jgi:CMP-N-acetylneuraminic acid synthetase